MSQPRGRSQLRARLPGRESGEAERGSLTLMLIVMFVALVALAGIVIDGGAKLTAAENANAVAQEAARAGAGLVNQATAYSTGRFVVEGQAAEAADQFLANAGYTGTAGPGPRPNTIEVTVSLREPTKVLSIIGINAFTVTGTAIAHLETGVTGPGR
jgi:Flp pilus assembly protein TadG